MGKDHTGCPPAPEVLCLPDPTRMEQRFAPRAGAADPHSAPLMPELSPGSRGLKSGADGGPLVVPDMRGGPGLWSFRWASVDRSRTAPARLPSKLGC